MNRHLASFAIVLAVLALVGQSHPAWSQLINVDKNYRISKVDTVHNRLEVQYLSGKDVTIFVLVDGTTKVQNMHHRPLSWTKLRKGDIVQVKGGLRPDAKIQAKTIILTNP